MKPIDWVLDDLERKRRVPIPIGVKEFKNRERLDKIIENKNLEALNLFFSTEKNFDFSSLDFLSVELKVKRNVSKADKFLINKLVEQVKLHGGFESPVTNSIGSLLQIEEAFQGVDIRSLPRNVSVVLMLWSYLTIIESCISDLSEMFYKISKGKEDQKYIRLYDKAFEKGEHPMFGQLRKTALRWKLMKPQDKNFLNSNTLRKYIAHANLYYDSIRNKIIMPQSQELSWEDFEKEYERIHDFFKELIFRLNDDSNDVKASAEKIRKGMAHEYLKLVRSGGTKKLWRSQRKLPWEIR